MRKLNYLFLILLSVGFVACEDDANDVVLDNTAPTISITSPASRTEYYPTDEILVQATVTDDTELETVTINVQGPNNLNNNFTRTDGSGGVNFSDNDRVDNVNVTIPLPANATPGDYVITVGAVDAQGNTAVERSVTVVVLEDDLQNPEITIASPTADTEYEIGDTIEIRADVQDDKILNEIRVRLAATGAQPIFEETVDAGFDEGNRHSITNDFTIPGSAPIGDYILTIEAQDQRGNVQTQTVPVSIVEDNAGSE